MNKIKKIFLALIVLFLGEMVFAQVQSYVGVVRPQKNEIILKFEKDEKDAILKSALSKTQLDQLEDEENNDESEEDEKDDDEDVKSTKNKYDKKIETNVFGTGFIYVAPDGTNYVLTNSHVICDCEKACIEFYGSNTDEKILYDDLIVLGYSDDYDLALLGFPNNERPFTNGLNFTTTEIKDGDEVYSAGYPGLQGKPSWQFAKGNISNSKAEVEDLTNKSRPYVIQHSAPIDSGNSGGPLLIKNSKEKLGYSVVGINTWKAMNRTLTGFTIPAETIKQFIDFVLNYKPTQKALEQRIADFSKALSNIENFSYDGLMTFISNEYALSIDYETYARIIQQFGIYKWYLTGNITLQKIKLVLLYPFIAKYRQILPKDDSKKDAKINYRKYSIESIEKISDKEYHAILISSDSKNKLDTVWVDDFTVWRIKSITFTKDSESYKSEKKYDFSKNYVVQDVITNSTFGYLGLNFINFTYPLVADDIDNYHWGLSYLHVDTFSKTSYFGSAEGFSWQYKKGENHVLFNTGLFVSASINIATVSIKPIAAAMGELDLFSANPVYGWNWFAGIIVSIKDFNLNISYQNTYLYPFRDTGAKSDYGELVVGVCLEN